MVDNFDKCGLINKNEKYVNKRGKEFEYLSTVSTGKNHTRNQQINKDYYYCYYF